MKWISTMVLLALAGLLLWQAGRMHDGLLAERQAMNPGDVPALESMPPMVAFTTVALGGFRGMIADMLWLRATKMQDEGRFFEMVQISNWITTLEPRFTAVWAFHAWNLAYNISVLFNEPADRWRWVRHGIEMLRDKALIYNPGDGRLYAELAWMFQHKIGENMDRAHRYYKNAWFNEMAALFAGRAPDYEAMAKAATSWAEVLERPGVDDLVRTLEEQGYRPRTPALLDQAKSDEDLASLLKERPAGPELDIYLRRKRMLETYQLDPSFMAELEAKYGPLDWRMAQAHALYWAARGLAHAEGSDITRLTRILYQSLATGLRTGAAFIDLDGNVVPSPNPDLIPYVTRAYEDAIADRPQMEIMYGQSYDLFLREAITLLYAYHRVEDARVLFNKVQDRYPAQDTEEGFERFIANSLLGQLDGLNSRKAFMLIEGALSQSYRWQAMGDDERAAGYYRLASLYYQEFMQSLKPGEHIDRLALPPFREMVRLTLEHMPADALGPRAQARLKQLQREAGREESSENGDESDTTAKEAVTATP